MVLKARAAKGASKAGSRSFSSLVLGSVPLRGPRSRGEGRVALTASSSRSGPGMFHGRSAKDRDKEAPQHGLSQPAHQLFGGQFLPFQVFFHQGVIGLGDALDELLPEGLDFVDQVSRQGLFLADPPSWYP